MAQQMLDKEMLLKEQKFNQQVETLRETNIGGVNSFVQLNAPVMYTPDEVVSKASALYNFVSESSKRNP
jgi:hypothetical protein